MIDATSQASPSGGSREFVFSPSAVVPDAETRAALLLRSAGNGAEARRLSRIAADILRSVQSRLPGRVRDLKVRIENDQFVLSGVSSSYYVKQVAQHVAMNALDALMLGRLVNEIEVRSMR